MSAKKTLTIVALAGAAALAAAPAQAGSTTGKPQTRTVKVYDDYFSPQKVTVNRGSVIRWFWPADDYQPARFLSMLDCVRRRLHASNE